LPVQCLISAIENNQLAASARGEKSIVLADSPLQESDTPYQSSPSDNILTYAKKATYKSKRTFESVTKQSEDIGIGEFSVTIQHIWDRDKLSAEYSNLNWKRGGLREETQKAIDATNEILTAEDDRFKDCQTFFGPNAIAALKAFGAQLLNVNPSRYVSDNEHGIRQSAPEGQSIKYYDSQGKETHDAKVQAYRLYPVVEISLDGPYFNSRSETRIGNYPAASLESRIVQILHELAHLIMRGKDGALIKNDGPNDDVRSSDNTSTILDKGKGKGNCRKAIKQYIKNLKK
jgi:hypothetical protein